MHHNSQKRINTSKLFWGLSDLTLTLQNQKHPSASPQQLCVHNTADSAVQESTPKHWGQFLCHFLTSVFTSVARAGICQSNHLHPPYVISAALHKRLSDYIYPEVSSMEMRLIGWVSPKCVLGSTVMCAHRNRHIHAHRPPANDGYF